MKLERTAGILLHITSLPSPFGIGDFGPEAFKFVDFLNRSNQRYWQILPLNPTEEGQGNSPYSSVSSMAGNTLLISPELLAQDNLLPNINLPDYYIPITGQVDFSTADNIKQKLFDAAWNTFTHMTYNAGHRLFETFCKDENYWLHDYALYILLKALNNGKPWFEWAEEYRDKNPQALQALAENHKDALQKTKWLQYVFASQWKKLKDYSTNKGLLFFGDLPFYASYDSVDVWSNRPLFKLDESGKPTGVAGVPPDAFSADGQLWGMPVYNWAAHKTEKYNWWLKRLGKNMEFFDLLRLDHFRAFADFWEVPADAETAIDGRWLPGPGTQFFNAVKDVFNDLPFIAEDLGEIDQPVNDLRDYYQLAGMKVLQFAFGHEMPLSPHIPHNYSPNFVVYTGTHDNNTIVGWFANEGEHFHHQINHYTGQQVTKENINTVMCRLAYSSVAQLAILPMQDILGLNENARMNIPASTENNWAWVMMPNQLHHGIENMLFDWAWLYNRSNKYRNDEINIPD